MNSPATRTWRENAEIFPEENFGNEELSGDLVRRKAFPTKEPPYGVVRSLDTSTLEPEGGLSKRTVPFALDSSDDVALGFGIEFGGSTGSTRACDRSYGAPLPQSLVDIGDMEANLFGYSGGRKSGLVQSYDFLSGLLLKGNHWKNDHFLDQLPAMGIIRNIQSSGDLIRLEVSILLEIIRYLVNSPKIT